MTAIIYRHVDREINLLSLVKVSTLPPAYELTVQRDHKTGALIGFTEVSWKSYPYAYSNNQKWSASVCSTLLYTVCILIFCSRRMWTLLMMTHIYSCCINIQRLQVLKPKKRKHSLLLLYNLFTFVLLYGDYPGDRAEYNRHQSKVLSTQANRFKPNVTRNKVIDHSLIRIFIISILWIICYIQCCTVKLVWIVWIDRSWELTLQEDLVTVCLCFELLIRRAASREAPVISHSGPEVWSCRLTRMST